MINTLELISHSLTGGLPSRLTMMEFLVGDDGRALQMLLLYMFYIVHLLLERNIIYRQLLTDSEEYYIVSLITEGFLISLIDVSHKNVIRKVFHKMI